jgi:hypothetical protein
MHCGELIPTGTVTLADNRRSAVLAAGASLRSRWVRRGGTALSTFAALGAGLTLRGRSSASLPPGIGDDMPLQPGASQWLHKYDASLNTLPSSQGFSRVGNFSNGSGAGVVSGGAYTMTTTAASAYWIVNPANWSRANDVIIERLGLRINTGHQTRFELYLDDGANRRIVEWRGTGANNRTLWVNSVQVEGYQWDYDIWYDLIRVTRYSGSTVTSSRVYVRARGTGTTVDLTGLVQINGGVQPSVVALNTWIFGAVTAGTINVSVDFLGAWQGAEWATTAPTREWVQFELSNPTGSPITLTGVDLRSNTAAPTAATVGTIGALGSNALGVILNPAAGTEAIRADLYDGPTLVATDGRYVTGTDPVGLAFGDLAAGSYTVTAYPISEDGVPGNSVTSGTQALPPVAPSVALVRSAATLAAGESSTITPTLNGGATATLDGVALVDGEPVTNATATAGSLIGPTAPVPQIRQAPVHPQPQIRWSDPDMQIVYSATQPTSYTLQRKAVSSSTWSTDATQATNPVNVSVLAYDGTTPGVSVATNHGWTLDTSGAYEYRLLPTYADGSIGQPSNALIPSDREAFEVTVSGRVDEQHVGKSVRAQLDQLVVVGGQEYLTQRYEATVATDGTWAIHGLPAGTPAAVAVFQFPDGSRARRALPTAAGSASFAGLVAP